MLDVREVDVGLKLHVELSSDHDDIKIRSIIDDENSVYWRAEPESDDD